MWCLILEKFIISDHQGPKAPAACLVAQTKILPGPHPTGISMHT